MGAMAWPAPSPGAPLEAEGDLRPREMTVHDGIRLIGLLGSSSRIDPTPYYGGTRGGVYAFSSCWAQRRGARFGRLGTCRRRSVRVLARRGHPNAHPGPTPADDIHVV